MSILLAIDDSKFSEAAVETVIEQARPHGTRGADFACRGGAATLGRP
jgi:hypothetical protein